MMLAWKISPLLAAGNTVVLKPAQVCLLDLCLGFMTTGTFATLAIVILNKPLDAFMSNRRRDGYFTIIVAFQPH